MQIDRTSILESVKQFTDSVEACAAWEDLPAATLVNCQRFLAGLARSVQTEAARAAAEIARRSRPELGRDGLSSTQGFSSAQAMVQDLTGSTKGQAALLVAEGLHIAESEAAREVERAVRCGELPKAALTPVTWETAIDNATSRNALSLEKAAAIRRGLAPSSSRPITQLDTAAVDQAVEQLLLAAKTMQVDALFAEARFQRDLIDTTGIKEREEQRRERRYLKWNALDDGMTRIHGLLDPESAAAVIPALEAMTSPRRGGPRFVSDDGVEHSRRVLDDPRSNQQIWLDGLTEMVRIAVNVDPDTVVGPARPMVKILVTEKALSDGTRSGAGFGMIEGEPDPIALSTVERALCEGFQPIGFDPDAAACVNIGRDRRLFTSRQRDALAVRDGGCMMPGCDRPPAWTEAHHIVHWQHLGKTNVEDGILVCRAHHLRLHNDGHRILRVGARYYLRLNGSPHDGSEDIPLASKNRLHGDIAARRTG